MLTPSERAFYGIESQDPSDPTCEKQVAHPVELLADAAKALENSASAIDEVLSTSDEPMPLEQVLRLKGVLRQTRATLNKLKADTHTNETTPSD